ncbi:MAG: hypothetical protein ACJAXQ_000956 [Parvibaculaceae bacterium]|jgi:hypothetical protein
MLIHLPMGMKAYPDISSDVSGQVTCLDRRFLVFGEGAACSVGEGHQ